VVALARVFPQTLFVICGDGPLAKSLQSQARDLANVRFMGWVTDTSFVYAAIDVLVLTSENEAVPTVLIEAALAGVPIVATDVGSVSEIVKHNETGLLAPHEDDLITHTADLLNSPALRISLGNRAMATARQHFSVEIFVRRHLYLYRTLSR
jgi:glycosyltransferase involved in cell wall biosynthesis